MAGIPDRFNPPAIIETIPIKRSWEEYVSVGIEAREQKDNSQWELGDLACGIEKDYGNDTIGKFANEIGVNKSTLKNYVQISKSFRKVPRGTFSILSYSHFREIAPLEDKEYWLEQASDNDWSVEQLRIEIKNHKEQTTTPEADVIDRPIVNDGENIYRLSEKFQTSRPDSWFVIKNGDVFPTLKRRSWFFHENGSEFSLREYARVQNFPDSYKFVGSYNTIKDQIGNAVSPKMAERAGSILKGKTFGDLFSGAGGFSCGLENIGMKSKWAVEINPKLAITYKVNHPDSRVITKDIRNLKGSELELVDVIVGGPPCQGLSKSGYQFKNDPRNFLYKEFLRIIKELQPDEFLMENVPDIQNMGNEIIKDFNDIGYSVDGFILNGLDIGMKQRRKRFFFYGNN